MLTLHANPNANANADSRNAPPEMAPPSTGSYSFKPSPYKVSTITATGCIQANINLDILYEHLPIVKEQDNLQEDGFTYVEYGHKKSDTYYKGFAKKLAIARRKTTVSKRFDNQVTVIIRLGGMLTNMKIFRNGNVQMTGLKVIDQGIQAIQHVIACIQSIYQSDDPHISDDISKMAVSQYAVQLINCDFRVGFEIKRDRLYRIIQTDYPNVFCSYEPCIYPGVKIQYDWNSTKKITVAVFQSGCVIITGAQMHEQIQSAYRFICEILQKHFDDIRKVPLATTSPV